MSRTRTVAIGALLIVVAAIVAAFALGGNGKPLTGVRGGVSPLPASEVGNGGGIIAPQHGAVTNARPTPVASAAGAKGVSSAAGASASDGVEAIAATSGVDATRVVKTGSLSLTVPKGEVATTITSLTKTTTSLGGYVSQSRTGDVGGVPTGSLTLRVPVERFEDAVTAAAGLGHETSLSTDAHDVTGKFVDLDARLSALKRTRSTYLTILSGARTIGQTLSVQQRVNDIQQQIESLQGELKVLRDQSADGTLSVSVTEPGVVIATVHHHRGGWSKAWHSSTGRFNRGIQTIIGDLGPLLLALILLGLAFLVARLNARRLRRQPG
jgi:hypothetical protein